MGFEDGERDRDVVGVMGDSTLESSESSRAEPELAEEEKVGEGNRCLLLLWLASPSSVRLRLAIIFTRSKGNMLHSYDDELRAAPM